MTTRRLLTAGALAGPMFVLSSMVQAVTRTGFDPARHPPSALALGDLGWVQAATFVVCGTGFTAGAMGLHRVVARGAGSWASWFVGAFGIALVVGGFLRMDPAFGFPPGTPDGVGESVSWHAAAHGILFPLGFACVVAAGWSLSRYYAAKGRTALRWTSTLIGPLVLVLSLWPNLGGDPRGRFWPLWAGVALAFGWLSLTLADLARPTADSPALLTFRSTS